MTATPASTSPSPVEEFDALPSSEEQLQALEVQYNLTSYDPSTDPLLAEELPRLLAEKGVDPLVQANVLAAVGKKSFPLSLQYEVLGTAEVRSLGDLAASRANEHAQQFLYPTAIKKILFGKYGVAKGRKLSSNIEVTYRRDRETGELTDMVITSGRHRVTAIIALLQYLGVAKWADQKVMVICKVVDSDAAFAQLIETANESRKMPRAELQVHGLTKSGVRTARQDEFYATRTNAIPSQYGHLFAKAVQFDLAGLPQTVQDSVVSMVCSAWNKVYKVNAENRAAMKLLLTGAQQEGQLREVARYIAENAMTIIGDAPNRFPGDRVAVGAPKLCAQVLAQRMAITAPTY